MNWIKKKLVSFGAGRLHGAIKKKNWVTKAGGLSLICSGLGMILSGFNGEDLDMDLVWQGVAVIGGGITALGYGRKFERTAQAAEKEVLLQQKQIKK